MQYMPEINQTLNKTLWFLTSACFHAVFFVFVCKAMVTTKDIKVLPTTKTQILVPIIPAKPEPPPPVAKVEQPKPESPKPVEQPKPEPPKPKVVEQPKPEPPKPKVVTKNKPAQPKPKTVEKPKDTQPKKPDPNSLAERLKNAPVIKNNPPLRPQPAAPRTPPRATTPSRPVASALNNIIKAPIVATVTPTVGGMTLAESESVNYADTVVKVVFDQYWRQPSTAGKSKLPSPVTVTFTVNEQGEMLFPQITVQSDDPAMNQSVQDLLAMNLSFTPLKQAGVKSSSLRIEVKLQVN